ISGCVTVTGPPASICLRKMGTTEPEEPRTLPKRTARKRVEGGECGVGCDFRFFLPTPHPPLSTPAFSDWTYNSATRLLAPITLVGFTALSVLTITKAWDSNSRAESATVLVPNT